MFPTPTPHNLVSKIYFTYSSGTASSWFENNTFSILANFVYVLLNDYLYDKALFNLNNFFTDTRI